MRLKSFDIDLRSYSGEEYERRYHLLDDLSWIMSEYADNPKVFRVSIRPVRKPLLCGIYHRKK